MHAHIIISSSPAAVEVWPPRPDGCWVTGRSSQRDNLLALHKVKTHIKHTDSASSDVCGAPFFFVIKTEIWELVFTVYLFASGSIFLSASAVLTVYTASLCLYYRGRILTQNDEFSNFRLISRENLQSVTASRLLLLFWICLNKKRCGGARSRSAAVTPIALSYGSPTSPLQGSHALSLPENYCHH